MDVSPVCPYCGMTTIYREGEVYRCANPFCEVWQVDLQVGQKVDPEVDL